MAVGADIKGIRAQMWGERAGGDVIGEGCGCQQTLKAEGELFKRRQPRLHESFFSFYVRERALGGDFGLAHAEGERLWS